MSASFFDYDSAIGGYRYITLSEGRPVESAHGGPHEEGWSRTYNRWEIDGDVVICTVYEEGRDCDGAYSRTHVVVCPVGELAAVEAYECGDESRPLPFLVPAWRERSARRRDYSAEAAGY